MKQKTFKLFQVHITYKCNKSCDYCYASSLKGDYTEDMGLEDFKTLLDWFEKNNIKSFSILGGEPTMHPQIKSMLELVNQKKMKIRLATNGLFSERFFECVSLVHSFLVNYNHESTYSKGEYDVLHRNLGFLKETGKPIALAFNITESISTCDYIVEAAKKYNAERVNLDLISPNSLKNNKYIPATSFEKNKEKINKFLETFEKNNIKVKIRKPLPLCIFKDSIKKYKGMLSSTCLVGQSVACVNPDLTVFPCLSIFFKGPKITFFNNFQEIVYFYKDAITDLKWKRYLYPKCETCTYFLRKKCQGSCLAYKC